ncbi:hypothetical protein EYF80_000720 [Liparis tanakae]|uniref:Uncharacterized protein n=1 Tax=Liparis tanakae TaxID=230148 RepID=A0A4Z2JHV2_9TELE|nr:hypothetical protein EYF80_000720 [Liparis tanakae]
MGGVEELKGGVIRRTATLFVMTPCGAVMRPSSGQWPTSASPWRGTMVYWQEDTGATTAGKHMSAICSESTKRRLHGCRGKNINACKEVPGGALTLLGPRPPKAEGDEGDNDEDEGSQDNTDYEVGEVAGPRHESAGLSRPVVRGLRWKRPLGPSTGRSWVLPPTTVYAFDGALGGLEPITFTATTRNLPVISTESRDGGMFSTAVTQSSPAFFTFLYSTRNDWMGKPRLPRGIQVTYAEVSVAVETVGLSGASGAGGGRRSREVVFAEGRRRGAGPAVTYGRGSAKEQQEFSVIIAGCPNPAQFLAAISTSYRLSGCSLARVSLWRAPEILLEVQSARASPT